jgi:hypothetical protein
LARAPLDSIIEHMADGMYGKNWNSPDPEKRPGEAMKEVWRKYCRAALSGALSAPLADRLALAERMVGSPLWMVHVRGPDELVPCESYEQALELADALLAIDRKYAANPLMPMFGAVIGLWPYSREAHAEGLARRSLPNSDYPLPTPPSEEEK